MAGRKERCPIIKGTTIIEEGDEISAVLKL